MFSPMRCEQYENIAEVFYCVTMIPIKYVVLHQVKSIFFAHNREKPLSHDHYHVDMDELLALRRCRSGLRLCLHTARKDLPSIRRRKVYISNGLHVSCGRTEHSF